MFRTGSKSLSIWEKQENVKKIVNDYVVSRRLRAIL